MKKLNKILLISIFLLVISSSIGYSALNQNLDISGELTYRVKANIRITNLNLDKTSKSTEMFKSNFSKDQNIIGVDLTSSDSQITYTVEVTNFSDVKMGIFQITGLPDNLTYELTDYTIKSGICATDGNCLAGAVKTFKIKIKYKDVSSFNSDNTKYNFTLKYDFRPIYKVTYENLTVYNDYVKEIIEGDTFRMELKKPFPIGAKPFYGDLPVEYRFEGDILVVENITKDLTIKTNYIQRIEDLVILSNNVNNGENYKNVTFIQDNNLDFNSTDSYRNSNRTDFGDINGINGNESLLKEMTTGAGYKPIGSGPKGSTIYFSGTYDGQNKTISNLYISNSTSAASVGLFGSVNSATVRNLKLDGNIKTSTSANMGSISGRTYGTTIIDNIENHVNVIGYSNSGSNGGILGSTNSSDEGIAHITIKNSKNYGNISDGNQSAGMVAWVQGELTIDNCHNYGNITIVSTGLRAGGLVSSGESAASADFDTQFHKLVINNSSNEGNVTSTRQSGGILGIAAGNSFDAFKYIILNSYNTGTITGSEAGGLVGTRRYSNSGISSYLNIYNSANLGKVVGVTTKDFPQSYVSGILGKNYMISDFYFDVKNIYSAGQLNGDFNYGISFLGNSFSGITSDKVYYPSDQIESNLNQKNGTYTYDQMKNGSFLNVMNDYVTSHPTVNVFGDSYSLTKWKIGSLGYPIPQN